MKAFPPLSLRIAPSYSLVSAKNK